MNQMTETYCFLDDVCNYFLCFFAFFEWHINLLGLFSAQAIIVEKQQ